MSEWRTDEYSGEGNEFIGELDVAPGNPAILRRIERLQFAVDRAPHDWQSRVALAQSLAQNGEFERSAAQLRASVQLVSERRALASIFFNLGICLENMERWGEAATAYEQCAFLFPNLFWTHYNLGVCLQRAGNLPYAIDELRLAAALDGGAPDVHQGLAHAYLEAGMLRDAEAACRRLLDLAPDSVWATMTLHEIHRRTN
jgi:tetratricopeptide (TPR) repeat protein